MARPPEPGLLRAQVAAIVEKAQPTPSVLAFRAVPGWQGPEELEINSGMWAVREGITPLQVRETLLDFAHEGRPVVLLTALSDADLGADVLARFHRGKVRAIDGWEAVRSAYSAREVDVLLVKEAHLARYLVEAPAVPLPGGVLSADIAWQVLFAHYLGLPGAVSDLRALLRWCSGGAAERLREIPDDLRASAVARLEKVCGPAATPVLGGVLGGHAAEMLPLGLACAALFGEGVDETAEVQAARVRLERSTGGSPVDEPAGRAWAEAAAGILNDLEAPAAWLERADAILEELHAAAAARFSALSPRGFEQRLEAFALALGEAAAEAVYAHRQAALQPERVERVRMAVRLARWLAAPASRSGALLADEARRYIESGAFVDWGRQRLVGGEPIASLAQAYRTLFDRVSARREDENRAFAEALRQWNVAGRGGGVMPVEDVLGEVVAPLARGSRVLLVVLDGMGWGVCHELLADLATSGWMTVAPEKAPLLPVIAALPTVTEASRASLLAGRLMRGDAGQEKEAFGRHAELRAACRADNPPQLFHRAELDERAEPWDDTLLTRIDSDKYRVIGVVVNAVDDHLAKDGQILHPWKLDTIRPLRTLLDRAVRSGRVVVLASDHGHVLEYGSTMRPGSGGERWRGDEEGPCDGELAFGGPRVLFGAVLPWSEKVRYGPKKWGYHGGCSPQEVLTPLVVLASPSKVPAGWKGVPIAVPAWWDPVPALPVAIPRRVREPEGQLDLFDVGLTEELGRSPILQGQMQRFGMDANALTRFLRVMESGGGQLPTAAAARLFGMAEPELLDFLRRAERVLNVDGYSALTFGDTVALNFEVLQRILLGVDPRAIRVETPQGQAIRFVLPFDPSDAERKALEALARYGTLGEAELNRAAGTRRVGFFETLVEKLSRSGWDLIQGGDVGPSGRIYTLQRERLP